MESIVCSGWSVVPSKNRDLKMAVGWASDQKATYLLLPDPIAPAKLCPTCAESMVVGVSQVESAAAAPPSLAASTALSMPEGASTAAVELSNGTELSTVSVTLPSSGLPVTGAGAGLSDEPKQPMAMAESKAAEA